MAEQTQEHTDDKRVFWLIAASIGLAFGYVFAVTFLSVPKDNIRFADTAEGFILGTVLAGCLAYYTGASATVLGKKPTQPDGTTTANITAEITQTKDDDSTTAK